jgi:microcystin-dependent protein
MNLTLIKGNKNMEGTLATVTIFAGGFNPRNWLYCNGSLQAIASNRALFSLLGTTYGGDGRTAFGLPDLRGATPIGTGHGPGLSNRVLGQKTGAEYNYLTQLNLPAHNHAVTITHEGDVAIPVNTEDGGADEANPGAGVMANAGADNFASDATTGQVYSGQALPVSGLQVATLNSGANQAVPNMQPSLAMNYIICMMGLFPSRS